MAQYMLLLHQVPTYNMDLPREKMLEMTKRYMAWADALRQKGRLAGGEKLIDLEVRCTNQNGQDTLQGHATVAAN